MSTMALLWQMEREMKNKGNKIKTLETSEVMGMGTSKAKYWDESWNVVWGCDRISEGCANCYAEHMVNTRFKNNPSAPVHDFHLQVVDVQFAKKFKRESQIIFVNNMSDTFHSAVPIDVQNRIVMRAHEDTARQYLLLTKRSDNMRFYNAMCCGLNPDNLWWGVTVESSKYEDRVADLLLTKGRRWLSLEPLLDDVCLDSMMTNITNEWLADYPFQWVVVGAESGPLRRKCKIEWVEHIVEDCHNAGVPVFVKQLQIGNKLVTDIEQFPEHLRIRETPWEINHG